MIYETREKKKAMKQIKEKGDETEMRPTESLLSHCEVAHFGDLVTANQYSVYLRRRMKKLVKEKEKIRYWMTLVLLSWTAVGCDECACTAEQRGRVRGRGAQSADAQKQLGCK